MKIFLFFVYVYCFVFKVDDERLLIDICERFIKYFGFFMKLGNIDYNFNGEGEVVVYNVRDVVLVKSMYCVIFCFLVVVVFVVRD